jgi:NADH-quinone oxidoreductase subunit H
VAFFYLIVYGFFLTAALGLLASWIDRKVTARVQYRVGPPLFQPLIDLVKLFGKETLVPSGASPWVFFAAPVAGFASVVLVSTILWVNALHPASTFAGDLIVVLCLLMVPSISLMIGGFTSRNPLASVGASREMKLLLSYELPFILAAIVPIIKANRSLRLGDILTFQYQNGAVAGSLSGVLALVVAILCVQAELGFVPFDVAEAETEIESGPLTEYSGTPLALYRLMKNMLLFVLPFFLIILYLGGVQHGGLHLLFGVLKYIGIVALITVIRNTNPRVRVDQAVRFFWGPMTIIAAVAVVLALWGK